MKKLPLFYSPPTICWIDDDKLFLDAANNLFENEYSYLSFTNPQEAVAFLDNYQPPSSKINFTREFTESDIYDTRNHLPIDINIAEITKLANTAHLKNEIAILVIDNNMPNMNGLEICEKFKNTPFKKILLTGQTSVTEALDAFNNGLIDKFIVKDQKVSENLQKNISELSYQYFYELTKSLISHLETSKKSPVSDPIFIDFFFSQGTLINMKEFYLIDSHGSFLVKDKSNSTMYFIVMSESDKNDFLKLNDDAFDKVGNLLLKVSRGEEIPFFGIGKEHWEYNYDKWEQYFHPSKVINGKEKYYWTMIAKQEILK